MQEIILDHKLTESEISVVRQCRRIVEMLAYMMGPIAYHSEELKSIWYNSKNSDRSVIKKQIGNIEVTEHNEFGYWANTSIGNVLVLMNRLNIKSICDLGCGAAFALKAMQVVDSYIDFYGYDNEPALINLSGQNSCKVKDIIKLERSDIDENSLLYFWEPIKNNEMCKQFVNNLANIAYKGQIIMFECAGYSLEHMRSTSLKEIGMFQGKWVFQKVTD